MIPSLLLNTARTAFPIVTSGAVTSGILASQNNENNNKGLLGNVDSSAIKKGLVDTAYSLLGVPLYLRETPSGTYSSPDSEQIEAEQNENNLDEDNLPQPLIIQEDDNKTFIV